MENNEDCHPSISLQLTENLQPNLEENSQPNLEENLNSNLNENINSNLNNNIELIIPKLVFIVPYRDRIEHKNFFQVYSKYILEDIPKENYEIYFVEQKDNRPFNRGAMKNIGFLAMKYKYPNDYKDITFVFNDVDTLPYKKNLLNYETNYGVVKHFYGFYFALGGIFSIKGGDFEKTNGFPNFWAWGGEDNYMQSRVLESGLKIDRSNFYKIASREILQMVDGFKRIICRKEAETVAMKSTNDGISTIRNLNFDFKDEYINVNFFQSLKEHYVNKFEEQDILHESKIHFKPEPKVQMGGLGTQPMISRNNSSQMHNPYQRAIPNNHQYYANMAQHHQQQQRQQQQQQQHPHPGYNSMHQLGNIPNPVFNSTMTQPKRPQTSVPVPNMRMMNGIPYVNGYRRVGGMR